MPIGQRHKAAPHQLQAVIVRALAFLALADTGQRFVERDEHGGEGSRAGGDQKVAVRQLAFGRDLHVDVMLDVAGTLDGFQPFHRRPLDQRRPSSQPPVPSLRGSLVAAAPSPPAF